MLSFRGLKYSYDEHGRTRSKQTASGTQYYYYDAEHRLTEVRIEQLTILNATATATMPLAGASKTPAGS
ncbi:RHS repeat domain-containing protein [Snodgrassella sp. ESL0323]|uniref:RHS repeat domain-containing protein n=1 Tax=Snodgrassella sp. ESL0323 TaxID=2705034 RepID=UPI001932D27D|nr:RHS repeat domain-containing protein [Snodgrassella sp. ESL0323]